ncbi:hypothetical protein [Streptomyces sp. NPDC054804]
MSRIKDGTVAFADSRSPAHAVYAFAEPPGELRAEGAGRRAGWTCRIEPGRSVEIGIACAYGTDADAVSAQARTAAEDFEATARAGEDGWRRLWASMFTPGNASIPKTSAGTSRSTRWNHVTVNLGAVRAGQAISKNLVGYDRPGATGGYRGYLDLSIG